MKLYGLLSCIRLVSGQEVVRQGEACCHQIEEQYRRPNMTTDEIRKAVEANLFAELDPLNAFSKACRNELQGGNCD